MDTSRVFPHKDRSKHYKLKDLAKWYLDREIQMQGAMGHDPKEDALAALDLIKMKLNL